MKDSFNLRKFLTENKLTSNSKVLEEVDNKVILKYSGNDKSMDLGVKPNGEKFQGSDDVEYAFNTLGMPDNGPYYVVGDKLKTEDGTEITVTKVEWDVVGKTQYARDGKISTGNDHGWVIEFDIPEYNTDNYSVLKKVSDEEWKTVLKNRPNKKGPKFVYVNVDGEKKGGELTYTFSEYDSDINDKAFKKQVEAGIKAKLPNISDEDLQTIIDSSVEYYADEARDENKKGRDADPTPSSNIVDMAVDYYNEEF